VGAGRSRPAPCRLSEDFPRASRANSW